MSNSYYGRSRAYGSIAADIDRIIITTNARLLALQRMALQDVVDNAQLPVGKGGRMRVDTGFLRASGQGSLNGMPTGPTRGESKEKNSYAYDDGSVSVVLGEMQLGAPFFFGWTAEYAKYRELFDGFLEGALQHWARIVAFRTDEIRERLG